MSSRDIPNRVALYIEDPGNPQRRGPAQASAHSPPHPSHSLPTSTRAAIRRGIPPSTSRARMAAMAPHHLSRPSHRRLFLNAGVDQRVPVPDEPASTPPGPGRRKGASARASPALRIAFSPVCSPAAGGRRTAAPPTPPPLVLKGWAPLPCQTRRRLRLQPCVVRS